MELWIRSQNKEMLYIAKEIYFYEYADNKVGIEVNQENFGIYKTKERALEVLDEIQDLLMGKVSEKHINIFDIYNGEDRKVYVMPKE